MSTLCCVPCSLSTKLQSYAAIPLIDVVGRVRQQFIGCILVAVIYAIWAGVVNIAPTGALMTLFTLSQVISHFIRFFSLSFADTHSSFSTVALMLRPSSYPSRSSQPASGLPLTAFLQQQEKPVQCLRPLLSDLSQKPSVFEAYSVS